MPGNAYLWVNKNNTVNMKRILLLAALAGMTLAANAQQALGPGTGLVSPEINPDYAVTFGYVNPKDKTGQVT